MAKQPPLAHLASGFRSSNKLNENFDDIRVAFDNTVSRDGSAPNQMEADFDINGYRILNSGPALEATDLVRLQEVQEYLAAISGNIDGNYIPGYEGSVPRPINDKLGDLMNVKDFGAIGDGIVDDSDAFQAAVDAAHGRGVYIPGGDYRITKRITAAAVPWIDVPGMGLKAVGAFAPGLHLIGDGMIETRIHCEVPNDAMFYMDAPQAPVTNAFRAAMGVCIEKLAVVGSGVSVADSTAFKVFNAYQVQFNQVHIRNLSGTAVKLVNGLEGAVPDSGWNMLYLNSLWIENCGLSGLDAWGIDATGTEGRNEGSFTYIRHVFIQGCGKNQYFTITNISQNALGGVVTLNMEQMPTVSPTASAHPFVAGDRIKFFGVAGMTQVNDVVYKVGSPTATTFVLCHDATGLPVDTSGFGAWTSNLPAAVAIDNNPILTTEPGIPGISPTTVVITDSAHGASVGDLVTISGAPSVGGITVSGQYRITALGDNAGANTANKYRITHSVPATTTVQGGGAGVTAQYNFKAQVVGEVGYYEPRSGGMRTKGQLFRLDQCGFTINSNVAHFVKGGGGGNIGLLCSQVTWENNYRRHLFIKGGINYIFDGCQFHGNSTFGLRQWRLAEFDASENVIQRVVWRNTKVRAKECPSIAFKYSGALGDPNSMRVEGTMWADYDYAGQERFVGVHFDTVQQDLNLHWTSTTLMALRPNATISKGFKTPYRLRGPTNDSGVGVPSLTGEIVPYQPSSTSGIFCYNTVTGLNGGGALTASTTYNIYIYDNDGVPALIPSLDAPVLDANLGLHLRTGDASMLWVGRARTDASSLWSNTGTEWMNPLRVSGGSPGQDYSIWPKTDDYTLRIRTTAALPTTDVQSNLEFRATLVATQTIDVPSLAAGANTTFTITTGVTAKVGDFVLSIVPAIDTDLIFIGRVSAANTITVRAINMTAGVIDLASTSFKVLYVRTP